MQRGLGSTATLLRARELGIRAHFEPSPSGRYCEPLWPVRATHPGTTEAAVGASRAFLYRLALCSVWDGHTGCVNALCWNDSGTLCLSGSDDTRIALWNLNYQHLNEDGELWLPNARSTTRRGPLEPNDYERYLAAEDEPRAAPGVSPERWRQRPLLTFQTGHSANIFDVRFVPFTGDRVIVSCAGDHEIRVCDLERRCIRTVCCHTGRVKKLAVDPQNPQVILSCSEDGTVRQFDLREAHRHRCRPTLRHSRDTRRCQNILLDVNEIDWRRIHASFQEQAFDSEHERTYRLRQLSPQRNLLITEPSIELYSLKLHPLDSNRFVVAGTNEFVQLYDRRMLSQLRGPVRVYAPLERRTVAEQHRQEREAYRQVLLERERRAARVRRRNLRRLVNPAGHVYEDTDPDDAGGGLVDTEPILGRLGRMLLQEMYESVSITGVAFSRDGSQLLASYAHDAIYLFDTEPKKGSFLCGGGGGGGGSGGDYEAPSERPAETIVDAMDQRSSRVELHQQQQQQPIVASNAPLFADDSSERTSIPHDLQSEGVSRPITRRRAHSLRIQTQASHSDRVIQADSMSAQAHTASQPQPMTSTTLSEHSEVSISHAIRPTGSVTGSRSLPPDCIRATATSGEQAESSLSRLDGATDLGVGPPGRDAVLQVAERNMQSFAGTADEPAGSRPETHSLVSRLSAPPAAMASHPSVRTSVDVSSANRPRVLRRGSSEPQEYEAAESMQVRGQMRSTLAVDGATSPADEELEPPGDWTRVPRWLTTRCSPDGSYVRCFLGHRNAITIKEVNFYGPNDEYVISGSDDGRVYIWDRYTGDLIQVFLADRDVVNCVEKHPYEPYLVTCGIDATIKLWRPEAPMPRRIRDLSRIVHEASTYHRQEGRPRNELRGAWLDMYELFYINLEPIVGVAPQTRPNDPAEQAGSVHSLSEEEEEEDEEEDSANSGSSADEIDASGESDIEASRVRRAASSAPETRLELEMTARDPLLERLLPARDRQFEQPRHASRFRNTNTDESDAT
ncbi:hypothetical protein, conserved [Cyanidioschyzon merolae strain 10D]|uniref:Uncharacterized protein n=1 Tax=Cyanidioschyzon merolae (strain NIES-3377 / 10D) TaxID=280699 RepID=M1V5K1_CYAM1|nr:hypothetical protein, conserved [Cyanidioschyzon merolae strain 10D]BAM80810.1 hypothetical protein, conserved [Cyanidioschyzon merolae strain 10D]|eukprot:XP_005536846.1 hypothetical protein, conserved [Cyanidioschyzon merolae strain 10D]